jgi:hypothetical protein
VRFFERGPAREVPFRRYYPLPGQGSEPGRRSCGVVHAAVVLALLLLLPDGLKAEEGRAYLDVSGGYKTGDFGTAVRADLSYLATSLGYVAPTYDVSVTVPYLSLSLRGQGHVSGRGDIIVRGDRVLVAEGERGFSLDGALAVKLPTADETKGLGTGETDLGGFLNAHQRVAGFRLSLMAGYIRTGQPANITYNNVSLYGIGLARTFGLTEVSVSLEGRTTMVPGAQAPAEFHAGIFRVLTSDYALKAGAFAGLNKGGPDSGFEAGLVRWF